MPTIRYKSRKKWNLKETFLFLRWHSGKENTHISSWLLDTLFLNLDYIPKTRKSTQHSTTTRYYNASTFYITVQMTQVCTHTSWLPEKPAAARSARGHDKVQTCYSIKGIIILVLWEKSFKSMEVDYSNHLASPLVASCREISLSP